MRVANKVNLKILIDEPLKNEIDALFRRKKISLTAALDSLLQWLLLQDDTVQSQLLGQTALAEDLIETILRRYLKNPEFDRLIGHVSPTAQAEIVLDRLRGKSITNMPKPTGKK